MKHSQRLEHVLASQRFQQASTDGLHRPLKPCECAATVAESLTGVEVRAKRCFVADDIWEAARVRQNMKSRYLARPQVARHVIAADVEQRLMQVQKPFFG